MKKLDAINRVTIVKKFLKDQIILLEDEDGDTLFIIDNGKVKVTSFSEHGKEVIFSIMYDGDFFGDMSLLDGKPRARLRLSRSRIRSSGSSDVLISSSCWRNTRESASSCSKN